MPSWIMGSGFRSLTFVTSCSRQRACSPLWSTRRTEDKHAWKTAHDADQAAPWGLATVLLGPDLFQMLAHSARLQLPEQPLHILTWRQAGLTFHLTRGTPESVAQPRSIAGTAANVLECD